MKDEAAAHRSPLTCDLSEHSALPGRNDDARLAGWQLSERRALGRMSLALSLSRVRFKIVRRHRLADESIPGPLRHSQAIRHIVRTALVSCHRGGRSPREVVV
jgi:hypothetical protein